MKKQIKQIISISGLLLFGISLIIINKQSNKNKILILENDELKKQLSNSNMKIDKLYNRIGKLLSINKDT